MQTSRPSQPPLGASTSKADMKMKKLSLCFVLAVGAYALVGCSSGDPGDTGIVKTPAKPGAKPVGDNGGMGNVSSNPNIPPAAKKGMGLGGN